MLHVQRRLLIGGLFLLGTLSLLGCGAAETEDDGPWTVQKGGLQLQENLRISGEEDFYFGAIHDVAVGQEGRIYVADGQAYHVKVHSPEGTLRDTVGARGEGPGEFRRPSELALARGDSLYVLDGYYGRVHVFAPELAFERAFLARSDQGSPRNMMIPGGAEASPDRAFLFVYSPGARAVVQEDARMVVRPVSLGGTVGDTLFTTPPYRLAWEDLGEGRMMFMSVPFMPGPNFALGPEGRVHYAWSDSLTITAHSRAGRPERTVRVPFDPVPVTDDEIEDALEDRSRGREQVRDKIPASKPAFDHFLVDDEGRYWFGRPTANPDSTAWWVAMPDARRVVTDTLSSDVELLTVRDGQAYGRATTEAGAPALVQYEFDLEPATSE